MRCPSCAHENPDAAKFCSECAVSLLLEVKCAACGSPNAPGSKFCNECAQPLTATTFAAAAGRTPTPALPASFSDGRYKVERFLGEGGRKRVYLAHDTRLDRDVAFAAIKTDGLDAGGVTRIRREAQAMGRLGDHPHIVTVFDTGEENGQPYIVSQYMAGGELTRMIDEAERRRLPIADAVRIATQVAQGLEHAHAHGIVHRDLKPGNIWLTNTSIAKIGDFGLALSLDRTRMTMQGTMVGTAAYMPPEQAMGGETTATSDLYALGCVIYEMVTGRPPFVGDDAVAVISQHVNTPPVAPAWHTPECPPGLETLITRLLAKDPSQRPASAAEVIQALASVDVQSAPAATASLPEEAPGVGMYARTFVGREAELKQLQAAFDSALSGQGALVMVVGEPGIGKTTVTEQLLTYVAMRGGRALVGHCYEEGSLALPYLPFVEAMRSYALVRESGQLQEELGTGAGEVARIVSEIRDRVAVELPPPGNPEEERFRLFQAVTAFLRNASAAQALCIVLEDLQDGDKGTMELLVHLARSLSGTRLLIIGTYRDVEVDRRHPLSAALADLRRLESFKRIALRGLSIDEVQRMLSNVAGQDVQYALAEGIYRQTEGNPLFIQEVARYLAESGLIKREGGQWVAAVDSLITQIPEGLRDVIGKRLSRLSEECNRILSIAAVMGRDFSLDVLREVAGVPEEQLLSAPEEAIGVSLLEEHTQGRDVRYRFTHAYFRQTLYGEMIAPRRLRIHNEVAKALERHYASRLGEHAAELAEHFAHSSTKEDLRKAVQYGELAAQRAAGVYAHGEAARLLEQALQVQDVLDPEDKAKRCDLLLALGDALMAAGEPRRVADEVAPAAFALAEALADDRRAARVCLMAVTALNSHGAGIIVWGPEHGAWVERLERIAAPGTTERVRADIYRAAERVMAGQPAEGRALALRALALARELNDPETLFLASSAIINWFNAPQHQEERLRLAEEFSKRPRDGVSVRAQGLHLMATGGAFLTWADRARAEESWGQLAELATRSRHPAPILWSLREERTLALCDGRLEDAIAAWERYVALAGEFGSVVPRSRFFELHRFLLYVGQLDEAAVRASVSGEPAEWPSPLALCALSLAHLGHSVDARTLLRRVMGERGIGVGEDEAPMWVLAPLLETAVLVGDREAATILAGRVAGVAALFEGGTCFARQLGAAAALLGAPAQARAYYQQALKVAGKIRHRPEIALTRLQLAALLLEHYPDDRAAALAHLNFAIEEFRDMKMQPSLERALRCKVEAQGARSTDVMTSIDAVARAVEHERPEISVHPAPDGTVTIMFSDIEGSTAVAERLGDRRFMNVLREHNAIVRKALKSHGGFEVKSEGDGFMVAFQSAGKALACASSIQKALAERNARVGARLGDGSGAGGASPGGGAGEKVMVRIGLHAGEVIKEGEDFFGRNVIMAARVASQAHGGEILASGVLKALLSGSDVSWGDSRMVALKGLSGEHEIWAVEWASR